MGLRGDAVAYSLPTGGTHGTMVANQIVSVLVSGNPTAIEVLNRSGSAEIYFTVNSVNPTVGGAGTFVIPAVIGNYTLSLPDIDADVRVLLISTGTPTFSVTGVYR